MKQLYSVNNLSKLLRVTPQSLYNKIYNDEIPSRCLVKIPSKDTEIIRFDLENLAKFYPNLSPLLDEDYVPIESNMLIPIPSLADVLDASTTLIHARIKKGIYPVVVIPSLSRRRKLKIHKTRLFNRHPGLKKFFK